MRVTVDSREFATKLKMASRYSSVGASILSQCVRLEVTSNALIVYTTNFIESCQMAVNAIGDTEQGVVMMLTKSLLPIVEDSGGAVTIRDTDKYLHLDYGRFKPRLMKRTEDPDEFPEWIDAIPVLSIQDDVLLTVLGTADKGDSGRPITMAVHLFPFNNKIVVMSTTGIIGSRILIEGELNSHIAMSTKMLAKSLPLFNESMVRISIEKDIYELSTGNSRIHFPSLSVFKDGVNVETISGMYKTAFTCKPIAPPVTVPSTTVASILHRARQARDIDPAAEIRMHSGLTVEYKGANYEVPPMELDASGTLPIKRSIKCAVVVDLLSSLDLGQGYTFDLIVANDGLGRPFLYIDGERNNRHFTTFVGEETGYFANKIKPTEI